MAKQLTIDEEKCLACEACVELCPEVFALDNLGKAYVRAEEGGSEKCIEEAVAACPAVCIAYEK
jgi:ferredoxin